MEVETTYAYCIKPSSPTPNHLKTHNLSLLDQFVPSIYIPMVLFYSGDESNQGKNEHSENITQQKLKQLRESLPQVLTHFYPLAGRIKDKFSIYCNDEGVHYTEAKANYSLVEFFNQSNFSSLIHKLLPGYSTTWEEATQGYMTMIQVTCFPCGGMVIGALISHMIADGVAASFFLNTWGSISRDSKFQHAIPNFDSPFPQHAKDHENVMSLCGQFLIKGSLSMRRFLFDAKAISDLKTQGSSSIIQNPTRAEVVSSLIFKCVIKALKSNSTLDRSTLVTHAVNMRRRAFPMFPESSMGNFVWMANSLISAKGKRITDLSELVVKLREAVKAINSEFVKNFQGEEGSIRYNEVLRKMVEIGSSSSGVDYVHCTSWCNFGLYNVDYGWGKPVWVSCTTTSPDTDAVFFNSVLLMDTPCGSGIEAWIYLKEEDMSLLEQDKELLTFATLDPNPLQLSSSKSNA